jgi:hypothetical protein
MTTNRLDRITKIDMNQVPTDGLEDQPVCIPNISREERLLRLRFGMMGFVVSLVILGVMMAMGISHLWRLTLFVFFAGSATGYFQWADKTCVAFARREVRKMGESEEKIEGAELDQVRKQARRVQIKAALAGLVMTAIAFLLP